MLKIMEVPLSEIIDRMTILRLKMEHSNNDSAKVNFEKELGECKQGVEEFKQKGINLSKELIETLYNINKTQWNLESEMRKAMDANELEKMGKLYIEIQISNKKRVNVKNQIAEKSGSGFKDISIN